MKCPKCKKEMVRFRKRGFGIVIRILCNNKKCWFYGIERVP